MNFYEEWQQCIEQDKNDHYYINSFLLKSVNSIEPLEYASEDEIKKIINFLLSLDKERLLNSIDENYIKIINPVDIIQFSNFERATDELTNLLKYEKGGLSFEDIGFMLIDAKTKASRTKYGENQAKTAKDFGLVRFSKNRPIVVENTNLGNLFPFLVDEEKEKLLGVLSLRNTLNQTLIAKSKFGIVYYYDVTDCLSLSTAKRRLNNVKFILELSCKGTKTDCLKRLIFEER